VTPPLNHPFNRSHEKVVTPDHVSEDIWIYSKHIEWFSICSHLSFQIGKGISEQPVAPGLTGFESVLTKKARLENRRRQISAVWSGNLDCHTAFWLSVFIKHENYVRFDLPWFRWKLLELQIAFSYLVCGYWRRVEMNHFVRISV
jgi:hypothetical protein